MTTLIIDNVTFTWSEEHGHWRAGELVLRNSEGRWHARMFGATNTTYMTRPGVKDATIDGLIWYVRERDPDFAAEFTRLQQSQQREQNESAVELLDQWKREDALLTPTELYEQKPERFEAWGLVWRRMKELDSSYSAQWGSGPLRLHCSDVNKAMIWSPRTGGVWCLALQSAYDAAVAAGVDFSGCERVSSEWTVKYEVRAEKECQAVVDEIRAVDGACEGCGDEFDAYRKPMKDETSGFLYCGECKAKEDESIAVAYGMKRPTRAFTVDTPPPRRDTLSAAAKWHLANTSHSGEKPGWEE